MQNIISINLSGNPNLDWNITFFYLSQLPKLVNVALVYNDYEKLPQSITGLSAIEMIWLGKNPKIDLTDIFLKLSKLDNLSQMRLGGNGYTQLPNEISLLLNIQNLWLSGKQWENIGPIQILTKLSRVALDACKFYQMQKL